MKSEAIENIEEMIKVLEIEFEKYPNWKMLVNPIRLRITQLKEVKEQLLKDVEE